MRKVRWSAEEIVVLRDRYPYERTQDIAADLGRTTSSVYQAAYRFGLEKSDEYLSSPEAMRLDGARGAANRFAKGHTPWNAGKKGWKAGGRSAQTRFKKGNKPQTWVPVGTERLTKDGVRERKVTDYGGYNNRDWRPVHVLLWEKRKGPVPDGHIVVFKDGNRENITIRNLECITRAENMRRNSCHRYPKEIARLIQLRGALNRKINERTRNEKSD